MNQDQARRWAEEVDLPEPDGTAEANMQPHPEGGYTYDEVPAWSVAIVREAIAAALVKLTQGQEPVAWERRLKFPQAAGAVGEWEKCGKAEATSMFDRSPRHEYRCLYHHPTPSQQEDRKPQIVPMEHSHIIK